MLTVSTVHTDVVVILIGKFHHLLTLCQGVNIWVAFGTGKSFTYYDLNAIYENLGREKSLALPVLHDVIPHPLSLAEARNLHGRHGTASMTLHMLLPTWHTIPLCT